MGLGFKLSGILFIVLVAMGGIGKLYYEDTQKKIDELQRKNVVLQVELDTEKVALINLTKNYSDLKKTLEKVNSDFSKIKEQNKILVKKLSDHDIGVLAYSKPKLVGRIINNASQKTGRCFEILSGATLTEKELNAKSGKEFNSECPWLWAGSNNP